MLDIIALYFLCKTNGNLAIRKGLKKRQWQIYTILAWIGAEFLGLLLAVNIFGNGNLWGLMSVGIFSAFGGYLVIKYLLEKMPDAIDDDINNIGVDDLRPPKN